MPDAELVQSWDSTDSGDYVVEQLWLRLGADAYLVCEDVKSGVVTPDVGAERGYQS